MESPQFVETTRLKSFLRYVVEEHLAGNGDRLKAYTIGLDVFERGSDFDPQTDTIVRVQAGKLRQRLDLYYAKEGREDSIRIHMPKGAYTPVFEVAAEPTLPTKNRHAFALDAASLPAGPAIAVLPFDNLSTEEDQDNFTDGIGEEIINALIRFRELRVISRKSAIRYKAIYEDPRKLGEELGVDYLLEGSVRRLGDNVRITTQLIETRAGTHLSSEHYDRKLTPENLFELQDDIASHVAAEIADPHGIISRAGGRRGRAAETTNMDAYECVLAYYAYLRCPSEELHRQMRDRMEAAVELDPNYSSAWATLSMIYLDELRGHYNLQLEPAPLQRALQAAEEAVRLDSLNSAAHCALSLARFHRKEFSQFREAAVRTLQLNPNHPDHLANCSACLAFSGDWDQGELLVRKAADLCIDPPGWYSVILAVCLYRRNNYESALEECLKGIANAYHWGPLVQIMILGQLGRSDAAAPLVAAVNEQRPDFASLAREEVGFWNFDQDAIEHIVEGWRKAGLAIDD